MSAVQLLIQRVTNGIIVSEIVPDSTSIDLATCAVFPGVGNDLLTYLSRMLPIPPLASPPSRMLPIPPLASPPQVAEAVREVRDIIAQAGGAPGMSYPDPALGGPY